MGTEQNYKDGCEKDGFELLCEELQAMTSIFKEKGRWRK